MPPLEFSFKFTTIMMLAAFCGKLSDKVDLPLDKFFPFDGVLYLPSLFYNLYIICLIAKEKKYLTIFPHEMSQCLHYAKKMFNGWFEYSSK